MKRFLYLFSVLFIFFTFYITAFPLNAEEFQAKSFSPQFEPKTFLSTKSISVCQVDREINPDHPKDIGSDIQKQENCKCLGRRSDGPLEGLCLIPCRCPSNCHKNE